MFGISVTEWLALLIIIPVIWVIVSVPAWIANSRGVSKQNLASIRVLAILGLFFGITWLVALVLACVYPAQEKDIGDERRGPQGFPVAALAGDPATACENCGRALGRLETPSVWQDHVVCSDCHGLLSRQNRA